LIQAIDRTDAGRSNLDLSVRFVIAATRTDSGAFAGRDSIDPRSTTVDPVAQRLR